MEFQKTPLSERPAEHQIARHRHEIKRRRLTVKEKTRITPNMIRIVFEGDDLCDFVSLAPDDHDKLES